jgi:NitT/TauT family transport system permease protein
MALILLQTDKVKKLLAAPASFGVEAFVIAGVCALFAGLILIGERVAAPMKENFEVSLSLWQLPKYTAFTLLRGLAAYLLSLGFTLVYGMIAAHNRRAEKVMLPALDVLQSLPVLTFLPGLVLLLVHLFPTRQIGLEIACVITIFTAQAWNMCFSFFGSVRGIPAPLREVAQIQHLSGWQVFRLLEVPASMIGLVWNSMMSMAGGWFFIATCESFNRYTLPGLGSYMSAAQAAGNVQAQVASVIAMVVMIVALDQLLWRPIVAWSERYKLEDMAAADAPQSWVMDLFHRSRIVIWANRLLVGRKQTRAKAARRTPTLVEQEHRRHEFEMFTKVLTAIALLVLVIGILWGTWALFSLLRRVPLISQTHEDWRFIVLGLFASFGRVTAALVLGAIWTLPVGILIGLSPRWSQRLQPVVQVVASFPAPMLFPWVVGFLAVCHVPFSIGCISLLLLGTQWYVLFNVIAGAMAIPSDLREAARVYHLGRWFTWRKLYIPAVFPYLVTGLLTATGGAWNATIVAEFFSMGGQERSTFGLGTIIDQATNEQNFPLLAAGAITMAIFVVTVNRLVWKKLYRVAEQRYSLNI